MKNNNHFAEAIESTLHNFVAQSWHWDAAPPFGSLVIAHAGTRTIFGIVHHVQTGSADSTHRPIAYRKTEEELKRDQPQIFEFLQTMFSCTVVGYQDKGRTLYMVHPEPIKIHTMIRLANDSEYKDFVACDHYLSLLFGSGSTITSGDELFLSLLRHQAELGILNEHKLDQLITSFCMLTNNDYVRLKLLLQRIESFYHPTKNSITV